MDWPFEFVYVPVWAVFVTLLFAGIGVERLLFVDLVRFVDRLLRRRDKKPAPPRIVKP